MLDENIAYVDPDCIPGINDQNFQTIQEAITWCGTDGKIMVKLCNNITDIPRLKFMDEKTININGQGEFSLNFTDNLIDDNFGLSAGQTLNFTNVKNLECEQIIMDSDNIHINFGSCKNIVTNLILMSGENSNTKIMNSNFTGFTDKAAIEINNTNTEITITDSTISGSINNPALLFNSNSNRKIKIKNSVILHGSSNYPIENGNNYEIGVHIYNCFSNKRICSNNTITNWVCENNNIIDPEITF